MEALKKLCAILQRAKWAFEESRSRGSKRETSSLYLGYPTICRNHSSVSYGNAANLNPLQTKDEATKFVTYMDGGNAILSNARQDYAKGEYRFVATVLNKLVAAQPYNNAASVSKILDAFAVSIDTERTTGKGFSILLNVVDQKEQHLLELSNGNLSSIQVTETPFANATINIGKAALPLLLSGRMPIDKLLANKALSIDGDRLVLEDLLRMVDRGNPDFELVLLS